MESQLQPEGENINSSESIAALEPTNLSNLSPTTQSIEKGKWIATQIYEFLAQIPKSVGDFFNEYKQLITSVALLLGAIIALRIVLAIMSALNDIPFVKPTLELVGVSYSTWFVTRYLLRESNRQELFQLVQTFFNKQD